MSHLLKPHLGARLPSLDRGLGSYVWDTEGRRYLDGSSGAVVAALGHGHPEIVAVMAEQAAQLSYTVRSQFTNDPAERLADRLVNLAGGDLDAVFLVNSGSEANETALKLALQHWSERGLPSKRLAVTRHGSYHGTTLGALSLSGHPVRRRHFEGLLHEFPAVPQPNQYRCRASAMCPPCDLSCVEAFDAAIQRTGAANVAAVVVEPVVGAAGGAIVPAPGYYQRLRDICDRQEVLLVADEVMTGVGRCGHFLAMEHWDTRPDLVVLGKGLGAGYVPVAAVLATAQVIDPIARGTGLITTGHTYSANPLAASVALAVLEVMEREDLTDRARLAGRRLGSELRDLMEAHQLLGDVRGLGFLWGLELIQDRASRRPFPREMGVTERFVSACQDQGGRPPIGRVHPGRGSGGVPPRTGLLVYPASDGDNDAILVGPPLNTAEADLELLVSLLDTSLTALESELRALGRWP